MKKLNKVVMIISKIGEILYLVAAVASLVIGILSVNGVMDKFFVENGTVVVKELEASGFEIGICDANGDLSRTALGIFFFTSIFINLAMFMVFRNIYLTIKTADGKTWFSKGETPFQKDISRMIREIGIFLIMVSVIGLIGTTVGRVIIGHDFYEGSVQMMPVIIGLVIICLSRIFTYGEKLEEDVEGLI